MDISFYHSSITSPAIAVCLAIAGHIFWRNKNLSTFSLMFGFILVLITNNVINYCIGISALGDTINNYPYLCNSITPHIQGIGFIFIMYGLTKFVPKKKNT